MFEQLRSAIEELSVPVDGRALTQLLAIADRLMAKVAASVGEFDRAGLWEIDGATSMRAWLRDAGLTSAEAGRLASTAQRVRALPVVAAAWSPASCRAGRCRPSCTTFPVVS